MARIYLRPNLIIWHSRFSESCPSPRSRLAIRYGSDRIGWIQQAQNSSIFIFTMRKTEIIGVCLLVGIALITLGYTPLLSKTYSAGFFSEYEKNSLGVSPTLQYGWYPLNPIKIIRWSSRTAGLSPPIFTYHRPESKFLNIGKNIVRPPQGGIEIDSKALGKIVYFENAMQIEGINFNANYLIQYGILVYANFPDLETELLSIESVHKDTHLPRARNQPVIPP